MTVSYDELPYGGRTIPLTHPDRLATAAALAGIDAAAPERCRILELGCAEGANLVPIAFHLPGAELVGVDAGRAHIERASDARDRLGLDNLRFLHADLTTLDPEALGRFDYVIAHGVLSWVAEPVRRRIFELCRGCLAPSGVAYLSYNTGPGWAIRTSIRDALLARTRGTDDVREKIARMRGVLALLADSPLAETGWGAHLSAEAAASAAQRDPYLVHEYLSEHNHVFGYREIVDLASAHDLAIVSELTRAVAHRSMEDDLRAALGGVSDDPLEVEELLDLLAGRAFRATLFARTEAVAERQDGSERALLASGWIAGAFRPESPRPSLEPGDHEAFLTPDGARVSAHASALKAALLELGRAWPLGVTLPDLEARVRAQLELRRVLGPGEALKAEDVDALREDLARLRHLEHVELRLRQPEMAPEAGPSPRTSALTRYEAKRGAYVTTPFHRVVEVDAVACHLIAHLDGSRDRAALAAALGAHLDATGQTLRAEDGAELSPAETERALMHLVERNLLALAVNGLIES